MCLAGLLVADGMRPGTASPAEDLPYPHLANIYLPSTVDEAAIRGLAKWDVVVLSDAWTPAQLEQLRALNPNIKIFVYFLAYALPRVPTTHGQEILTAYVQAFDLWWYDTNGKIASDWRGTGMVNVTSLAPGGSLGRWRDLWVSYVAGYVLERPQLDGVYLDNFWQQISWQQNDRRLDSDCSPWRNPRGCDGIMDSPEKLDSLWREGLTSIATLLRQRFDAIEPQRSRPLAMISNGASDYFEWLNGTLYEYFPSGHADVDFDNPYGYNWNREMFDATVGYLAAPFRTDPYSLSILNVEHFGDRWSPARSPGFERKLRFTLVSSMMGSGYYSLDAGHSGNANLWWEPEYDHAGRGKGYLGRPLGPAVRLLSPQGAELLRNGNFGGGTSAWQHYGFGALGTAQAVTNTYHSAPTSLRIDVLPQQSKGTYKVWQQPVQLVAHQDYTLSFWARGQGELVVQLYGEACPDQTCWGPRRFRLQPQWTRFETSFRSKGTAAVGLDFLFSAAGSAWMDDVSLRAGDTALFRRDFERGTVLLNYTFTTRSVSLGTTLHRLLVPQSDVFDGKAITTEIVPPFDARILLRDSPSGAGDMDGLIPGRSAFQSVHPNPFNPRTEIRFGLDRDTRVHVKVFDIKGRLVRVLVDGDRQGGIEHAVSWDGLDDSGREAPSGLYLLHLTTPRDHDVRKIVLAR